MLVPLTLALITGAVAPPALAHAAQESRPPAPAHPLVGAWRGTSSNAAGALLTLEADGTGRFGDAPLTWRTPRPRVLVYVLEGESVEARYTLDGARLTVRAAGEAFVFERAPARPVVRGFVVPPPLEGAAEGPTVRLGHSAGYYAFEAPRGWSLGREDEDGLWLNPGLAADGTLDALVRIGHGELEEHDRGAAPAALVVRYTDELVASLRELGLELEPAAAPPRAVLVGELPGALQEWRGAQRDGKRVRVWLGGLVVREWYLTLTAILVEERAEAFVPGLVRVFGSLAPRPPERNAALEAALAGRAFKHTETFPGAGSSYSTYSFQAGGSLQKELLMGGRIGLDYDVDGSTSEWGRYEVVGDLVYLRFRDGQLTARPVVDGERLVGLRVGDVLYHAR